MKQLAKLRAEVHSTVATFWLTVSRFLRRTVELLFVCLCVLSWRTCWRQVYCLSVVAQTLPTRLSSREVLVVVVVEIQLHHWRLWLDAVSLMLKLRWLDLLRICCIIRLSICCTTCCGFGVGLLSICQNLQRPLTLSLPAIYLFHK